MEENGATKPVQQGSVYNEGLSRKLTAALRKEYPDLEGIEFRVLRESEGHVHSQSLHLLPSHKVDLVLCETAAKMHLAILREKELEEMRDGLFIYLHEQRHAEGISSHRQAEKEALEGVDNKVKAYAIHFAIDTLMAGGKEIDIDRSIKELMFYIDDSTMSRVESFEDALEAGLVRNTSDLGGDQWEKVKELIPKYVEYARFLPFLISSGK
ncbi:MAG: hypothetical protein KGI04_03605 [Candidatus Micrarchaeota archaeon]|nr:hypothetical protein [Candidatus Micrarchaeota archaeon]